jgi:ClpP class serine protease
VDEVAASGGYMMACVADRIVASPFAVLGSIGVITEIPNVYERLQKEGVQFQTVTAGEYKRTLTPFKKVDPKDVAKTKAEIDEIFSLFKGFVAKKAQGHQVGRVELGVEFDQLLSHI